jgi:hypothetical protein
MKKERAIAVRRLLAFAVDWLVVVLWGGMLFGAQPGNRLFVESNGTRHFDVWERTTRAADS